MAKAIDLLKRVYYQKIKENPQVYIGVELEFPLVHKKNEPSNPEVSKVLLLYLSKQSNFKAEKYNGQGELVEIFDPSTEDRILFEVSYNILEIAFGKATSIQEIEQRFQFYLTLIQEFLAQHNHEIQGQGIHPAWAINDNRAVSLPRYQMLLDFLALSKEDKQGNFHAYPDYGSFICGNQVQLDVSRQNYLRVINAFNKIEAVKAYLFANSKFEDETWSSRVGRDIFWEESMHGVFKENVGVNPKSFIDEDEFWEHLSQTAMFTVEREGELLYFQPIRLVDFFRQESILARKLNGEAKTFVPQERDVELHRSYQYQNLTKRGTIEFRSTCTQPLVKTFAPTAFHLGLLANLENLESLLEETTFFTNYAMDYAQLRRHFSQINLNLPDQERIRAFSQEILTCAQEGLKKRAYGEEKYLENIIP